jgi:hypothetical protein
VIADDLVRSWPGAIAAADTGGTDVAMQGGTALKRRMISVLQVLAKVWAEESRQ